MVGDGWNGLGLHLLVAICISDVEHYVLLLISLNQFQK
jgi:hypothetical protein